MTEYPGHKQYLEDEAEYYPYEDDNWLNEEYPDPWDSDRYHRYESYVDDPYTQPTYIHEDPYPQPMEPYNPLDDLFYENLDGLLDDILPKDDYP